MKKVLLYVFIMILVLVSLIKTLNNKENEKLIDSNRVIVKGVISDYYLSGSHDFYLKYKFKANNRFYERNLMPDKLFRNCENDRKCIGKEIYVKYNKEDPSINQPIFDSIPNDKLGELNSDKNE